MSASRELLETLNRQSNMHFWSAPHDNPTFKEIVDRYFVYYQTLDAEQQKELSNFFWEKVKSLGTPIIEDISGDEQNSKLTFLMRGNSSDKYQLVSSICGATMMKQIQFIEGTDIWFLEVDAVPNDARISYQFLNNQHILTDPFNSYQIPGLHNPPQNIYDMPKAKKQPFLHRETLPKLALEIDESKRLLQREIDFERSTILKNKRPYMDSSRLELTPEEEKFRKVTNQGSKRKYWIHLPPDYDPKRQPPYKILLHLDGYETIESMRAHAVMENAIKDKAIEPTITIFLDVGNRNFEYGPGSDGIRFANFVAKEFLPSLQGEFEAMSRKPSDITIAGYSMGGHAAVNIATLYPDVFGSVISQSGSFWMGNGNVDTQTKEFKPENEGLKKSLDERHFPDSDQARDMCFYLTVGSLETTGGKLFLDEKGEIKVGGAVTHNEANENLAKYLRENGLSVHYLEYSGDHNFAEWQGGLIEGLREIQLLRLKKAMEQSPQPVEPRSPQAQLSSTSQVVLAMPRDKKAELSAVMIKKASKKGQESETSVQVVEKDSTKEAEAASEDGASKKVIGAQSDASISKHNPS